MKKILGVIILVVLFLSAFLVMPKVGRSQNCSSEEECKKLIEEYEKKLTSIRAQKSSLSSEIEFANTQIYLTTLRVQETEKKVSELEGEIDNLGKRIEGLNTSLDYLSKVLLSKIIEGYKNRQEVNVFNLILDSENASTLAQKLTYLKTSQENDSRIAFRVQQAKLNFEQQKKLREDKKVQLDRLKIVLDEQKKNLDNRKAAKQRLLDQTNNDERTYQSLLAATRAEFAAIQGIIAGAGTETELREVKKGDTIASVIPGASCNSSGSHLHFIVQDNGNVQNPFNYLKSVDHENCSGSSCGSNDGDPFNPTGNWDWPLNPRIEFNQGYGETWAVRNTYVGNIYRFHNGIDVAGTSSSTYAVADGTLYRGSYAVGCTLSYAKVVHKDSNIVTFYLHVYVQ